MIVARLRAFVRDRRGASAVEFALVVGPFLLAIVGSIEFGRAFWVRQALYESAIAGARCVALPQTECATSGVADTAKAQTFVIGVAAGWKLTLTSANLTFDKAATCGGATGFSKVTATYTFRSVAPSLIKALTGNPITVSACFPNPAAS